MERKSHTLNSPAKLKQDIDQGLRALDKGQGKPFDETVIENIKNQGRQILTGCDENPQDISRR